MHVAVIQPPSCYRCFSCGICGDFKNSGDQFETCDGGVVEFGTGWWGSKPFNYDVNGNTWEKNYRDTNCPVTYDVNVTTNETYVPENPTNFTFVDPCDPAIK